MQKLLTYGLAFLMFASIAVASGCGRGYVRSRTIHHGDRNVTIIKRPKSKGVMGRTQPVTTTKYNRVPKKH
jgi:hypothetical protein